MIIIEAEAIQIIDTVEGEEEGGIIEGIETTEMIMILEMNVFVRKDTMEMIDRIMETEAHIQHPKSLIIIDILIKIVQMNPFEIQGEFQRKAKTQDTTLPITKTVMEVSVTKWIWTKN